MAEYDAAAVERRSASIWPTALKFALFILVARVVLGYAVSAAGMAIPGLGLLRLIAIVVLLVLALRSFTRVNGGVMSFGQAFGIAFVASVLSAIVNTAITSMLIRPEALEAQRDAILDQLADNPGIDAQTLDAMTSVFEGVFTPGGVFLMGAIVATLGWTIVSLILAAIMKKTPATA